MLGDEWRKLQDEMRVLAGAYAAAHRGQADLYLLEANAFCDLPAPVDPDTLLERHSESVTLRARWADRASKARRGPTSPGRPAVPGPVLGPAAPPADHVPDGVTAVTTARPRAPRVRVRAGA